LLLRAVHPIDRLNAAVGQGVRWLILIAVLICSGNASVRYILSTSSNAWLEAQWYLFAAVFLLGSGYTLLRNEHVRIDVFSARASHRTQAWIDVFGTLVFLLPMALLVIWLSWPVFMNSFALDEGSADAGGLLRWPVKLLIPVGFTLLALQGIAELVKRIAFLKGLSPDPFTHPAEQAADALILGALKRKEDAGT
jgi:TRAP-type mannitol/chloroaromatic compound transport system permease small subunit